MSVILFIYLLITSLNSKNFCSNFDIQTFLPIVFENQSEGKIMKMILEIVTRRIDSNKVTNNKVTLGGIFLYNDVF